LSYPSDHEAMKLPNIPAKCPNARIFPCQGRKNHSSEAAKGGWCDHGARPTKPSGIVSRLGRLYRVWRRTGKGGLANRSWET